MLTTNLQTITLIIYANYYLQGHEAVDLLYDHEIFEDSKVIEFITFEMNAENKRKRIVLAENTQQWFHNLKENEVTHVSFLESDGRWLIKTIGKEAQYWQCFDRIKILDQDNPDGRCTTVEFELFDALQNHGNSGNYFAPATEAAKFLQKAINLGHQATEVKNNYSTVRDTSEPQEKSLKEHVDNLDKSLNHIIDFCNRNDAGSGFIEDFKRTKEMLKSDSDLEMFLSTSTPPIIKTFPDNFLDPYAERVLMAVQQGWVFGAMGSWNDIGEQTDEYEHVTGNYYNALTRAMEKALDFFDISSK